MNNDIVQPVVVSQLLNPREAAKKLRTSYGVLAVWRCTRRHPLRFVRLGRRIFYRPEDLQKFIERQLDPGDGPRPARKKKKV